MFQQTTTQYDLTGVDRYTPLDEKFLMLALLVVCVVITVKLVPIWLFAPPFRQTIPSNPSKYRKRLELSVNALAHWLWLPVFFWLFFSAHRLYTIFRGLEILRTIPISSTMGALQELANYFSLSLSVTAYAFLLRWHLLVRLTKLRD